MNKHDERISELDRKVESLRQKWAQLGKGETLIELLRIMRLPGYTTSAELGFNMAVVDSMCAYTEALRKQSDDLLTCAKLVIKKEDE